MADEMRMSDQGREPFLERPDNARMFPVGDNVPSQGQIQQRPDADIKSDCETALFYDTAVSSLDVQCDCSNGIVTLHGAVDSDLKKRLAGEDAWKVPGVKDVRNEVQVQEARIPSRAAGEDLIDAKPPTNIKGEPVDRNQLPPTRPSGPASQGPSRPSL